MRPRPSLAARSLLACVALALGACGATDDAEVVGTWVPADPAEVRRQRREVLEGQIRDAKERWAAADPALREEASRGGGSLRPEAAALAAVRRLATTTPEDVETALDRPAESEIVLSPDGTAVMLAPLQGGRVTLGRWTLEDGTVSFTSGAWRMTRGPEGRWSLEVPGGRSVRMRRKGA